MFRGLENLQLGNLLTSHFSGTASAGDTTRITETSGRNLIWSFPKMVAHHTIGGCNLRVGDLFGSGTISGTDEHSRGSMLEQNMGGKQPIKLSGGQTRMFLEDGDIITIRGVCGSEKDGLVGFGECTGAILPAVKFT